MCMDKELQARWSGVIGQGLIFLRQTTSLLYSRYKFIKVSLVCGEPCFDGSRILPVKPQ